VSKEKGPYVVDTLPAPESNPWKAWLRWTGLDFFSDGRAALCTWNGDVWVASGIDAGLDRILWKRFAAGLYEPLGLKIVKDEVHVLCRDQITRLRDLDGDGEADFYANFWNGLVTVGNYHAFAFELHTDSKGNFYCTVDGQRVDPEVPLHGCLVRISPDGRSHEVVARGLRAPNGMSVGPNDEITVSDNQGNWIPTSRLNLVRSGGFYGFVPHAGTPEPPKTYDPPLCWIPMAWDNSSGGQIWVTSDAWGPLRGKLLHTSYGTGSLFLVPFERVDGVAQGAIQKFPLSFSSGIMRGRFHPKDGQLYVAGLKGWQTTGVKDPGFYRVRYTGGPVEMLDGWHAEAGKLSLTFTSPLDPETAAETDSWGLLRWNYLWSEKYGSNDYSIADPKKQVRDPVELKSVKLSPDGRTVTFGIPDLAPAMQMQVKGRIRTATGAPLPVEVHLTLNRVN
jgi:glucose/arabinose dehydrogenase